MSHKFSLFSSLATLCVLIGSSSLYLYGEGKLYNFHFLGRSTLSKQTTPPTYPTHQEHTRVSPTIPQGTRLWGMVHLGRQQAPNPHICSANLHFSR